jgi:gliding motility-associated-like protein
MVYDLVTSPSGAPGDVTGYSPSANNIPYADINNTLINTEYNYRYVTYRFSPKIKYNGSRPSCKSSRDTSIRVYVNPVPRLYVNFVDSIIDNKGNIVNRNNDSICFNQGLIYKITSPNDTVIGKVRYYLSVSNTGGITGVAPNPIYDLGNLPQSLVNTNDTIQTLVYIFTPFIEGNISKNNCNNGIMEDTAITIAPELKYNLYVKSRELYHGADVRCYGEKNGTLLVTDLTGGFYNRTPNPYFYEWNTGSKLNTATNLGANTLYTIEIKDKLGCYTNNSAILTQPDTLKIQSVVKTRNLCDNIRIGAIDIEVAGGTQGYTYVWTSNEDMSLPKYTQDLSNLIGGNSCEYNYLIKDINKCEIKGTYFLGDRIKFDIGDERSHYPTNDPNSPYNVSCFESNDGYITIGYQSQFVIDTVMWYDWNNKYVGNTKTITGLRAGTYRAEITSIHGCKGTYSVPLNPPDPLIVDVDTAKYPNGFGVQCFGDNNGRITLTPSGGHRGYVYYWEGLPGFDQGKAIQTSLRAGTYYYTVADQANDGKSYCSVKDTITLIQPDTLKISLDFFPQTNGFNIRCKNDTTGAITISATGGYGSISYLWTPPVGVGLPDKNSPALTNLRAGNYKASVIYSNGACIVDSLFTLTEPESLEYDTIAVGNNYCYGEKRGFIHIDPFSVKGGVKPYVYNWWDVTDPSDAKKMGSNTYILNGLANGEYLLNLTDGNSCTLGKTYPITSPTPVRLNVDITNVSCSNGENGSIVVNPTGGTPGYTYSWDFDSNNKSNTLTNLQKGDYRVVVTDKNDCDSVRIISIIAPDSLLVESVIFTKVNGFNVSCYGGNDGAVKINVNGGSPPYSFLWSNNFTGDFDSTLNATDLYIVDIKDSKNCSGSDSFQLTQPLVIDYKSINTNNNCFGEAKGSIVALNNYPQGGFPPYSYMWNDIGIPGKQKDRYNIPTRNNGYMLTVIDSLQCNRKFNIDITQPPQILVDTSLKMPYCPDTKDGYIALDISGGVGLYRTTLTNIRTNEVFNSIQEFNLAYGLYTYNILDGNNCSVTDTFYLPTVVSACLDIPNAFSPNGDGKNDTWKIYAGDPSEEKTLGVVYPNAIVEVFNRWGVLIFRSEPGYWNEWNGNFKGRPLPLDSYYYVITLNKEGAKPVSGIITIVK